MKRSALGVLFLTVVIDLLGFGIVLPLLPQYADDFHATGLELALLMASFSAMQFLFAPMWGRISDRRGRRPVLMVGLAGSTLSYVVFGLAGVEGVAPALGMATPLPLLFASRIAAGFFGATIGTAHAYIADVTTPEERGRGMALIGIAFGIGFTVGPALGGFAHNLIHPSGPGFVAAGLSFLALMLAFRFLEEPETHGKHARRGWLDMAALRHAWSTPTVLMILGLQVLGTFAFANFEGTLALFTRKRFDYDITRNAWLFTYTGFCLLLAQGFVVRRLVKRVGELNFTVGGTLILVIGMVGIAMTTATAYLYAVIAFAVLGFAMLTTSLQSLLSLRTPASMQGEVLGLGQSGLALARILGPACGMLLLDVELELPFWVGAGVMGIAFLGSVVLRRAPAPATE